MLYRWMYGQSHLTKKCTTSKVRGRKYERARDHVSHLSKRAQLILLFVLVGCEAPIASLALSSAGDLDVGLGGYTGSVNPFTIPVQLRVREVPFFGGTLSQSQTSLNEPTVTFTLEVSGSVRKLGEKYVHTSAYEALNQGNRVRRGEPLWVRRELTDELGSVEQTEITVSDVLKKLGVTREDFYQGPDAAYPIAPLSVGDDIFEGGLGVTFRDAAGFEKLQIRSNTIRATAKGLTFQQGKQHLMAELGGFLDLSSGGDQATLTVKGFFLIDIDTGLITVAQVGITATGRKDGNPFARETVSKLEQRSRQD